MIGPLMTLDPPYELGDEAVTFKFVGWTEVDDAANPDIALSINGRPAQVRTKPLPSIQEQFPGVQALGLSASVDFRQLLAGVDLQQHRGGFLVEAELRSGERRRTFEYAVSPRWMTRVFGFRPRPVPPAHLQIRVTGAAAGGFCRTGEVEAERLAAILAEAGHPFEPGQTVLDFGAGPGRLIMALAPRHLGVRFHGTDIDSEAMAWAARELGDLAAFSVNPLRPPMRYADATFDLVYSLSTFTHMPEDLQFAWLDELRRVLKPGGLLVTTKMNPFAYDLPEVVQDSARATGFAYWDDADETEGLPSSYRLAYHTEDYVRREWTRGFEVLRIGAHDLNNTQDSVVLRTV